MKPLLITIDGPAGAGKSTVSKILAQNLGYRYLDTGALYRAVAFKVIQNNVPLNNGDLLLQLCQQLDIRFVEKKSKTHLICNGKDITHHIRTEEISMMASKVSANPIVRKALFDVQREIGRSKKLVAEGRDMGTVVFADADIKFYLDASPQTRAARRYAQLDSQGLTTLEQVEKQIRQRDQNDTSRNLAPLKPAHDAIVVDSTKLTIHQVVEQMMEYVFRQS